MHVRALLLASLGVSLWLTSSLACALRLQASSFVTFGILVSDVTESHFLSAKSATTVIACQRACVQVTSCDHVIYCDASQQCLLLGVSSGVLQSPPHYDNATCSAYRLSRCQHGDLILRGTCRCHVGWTGFFCEKQRAGFAYGPCQSVFRSFTNGSTDGDLGPLKQHIVSQSPVHVKVIARAGTSRTVRELVSAGVTSGVVWGQALRAMRKENATAFSRDPARRFEMYNSNGGRHVFHVLLTGTVQAAVLQSLSLEWLVCPRPVTSASTYSGTDVTGLLRSVAEGGESCTRGVDVTYYNPAATEVANLYLNNLSQRNLRFQNPPYWYIEKRTWAKRLILRSFMGTSTYRGKSTASLSAPWPMDEGWTWVYAVGGDEAASGTTGLLQTAALRGHLARVTGNQRAARAQSVVIRGNDVIATLRPYVEPGDAGGFTAGLSRIAWTLMTSRGQVITCSQVLETSADWRTEQVSAQVSWFVDGRDWRRVLIMEPGGVVFAGSRENLYRKLETGASLRLGLRRPEEYQLVEVESVELTDDGDVTAEVVWMLEVGPPVGGSPASIHPHCLQASILISTTGEQRLLTYSPGLGGNVTSVLDFQTIQWFVEF